ncbi:putative ACR [uncultured archaeon]|nr:putative ACR [uncultured archaeon]
MDRITLRNYELADTILARAVGIMFRKRIGKPMLFVFPASGRVSIHSFFCPRFDAVFLDDRKNVTELYENIGPGHLITPKRKAAYLVEFPPNTASRRGIHRGTIIKFGR